jgi:8-oxo-dGTP diphosphatase
MTIEATLLTIIKEGRILLQRKASGRFGEGKWNGVGGKIRPGESPDECVKRETKEETGLKVYNLTQHGTLCHYFGKKDKPDWIVYHYSTSEYQGETKESAEGELKWFPIDQIPYNMMWQDDEYWLPLQIQGKRFLGDFYFTADGTQLIRHNLEIQ